MAGLAVVPLPGMPPVEAGDDLAALLLVAVRAAGADLEAGDVLVVSSKVVSKALGLWADPALGREEVVAAETRRVVAERQTGERVTRVVHAEAGPVMAAAGVDASNTGDTDRLLLLPRDPDAAARDLRGALRAAGAPAGVAVVLTDTAGRPWRSGQTDFALGAAGLEVLDDLRGSLDADGRPLAVTARAVADELAAAADLVKGKAEGVPAALVRGASVWVRSDDGPGAAPLLRTGPGDWFALGHAEAVRASLGVAPGSPAAAACGLPATHPEPVADRVGRAVRVALHGLDGVAVDAGTSDVRVSAASPYALGLAVARLAAALWGEGLAARVPEDVPGLDVELAVTERGPGS